MKILIITGGNTSERKISLWSARSIKKSLEENGYKVKLFDLKKGFSQLKKILPKFDLAFPVLHGKQGEDGTLYKFLNSQKIPYVGSDPKGAKIAFDKILSLRFFNRNKIPTADWKIIKTKADIKKFGFPCVLKAAWGGSSIEVIILKSEKDLKNTQVRKILNLKGKLYIEQFLNGVEITVGVLGQKVLPVLEIIPPNEGWFDYKNKYSGESKEIPFAPSIDKKNQELAQKIALDIHKKLKLGSYSRSDFIIANNIPTILEVNTPGGIGMTPESLFPKAAKAAGISFMDLSAKLVDDASLPNNFQKRF